MIDEHKHRLKPRRGDADDDADDDTYPANLEATSIYNVKFCPKIANEWSTDGTWAWDEAGKGCSLASDDSAYNMAWMGRRNPLSLAWDDYTCTLSMEYAPSKDISKRSLVTYATSTTSEFSRLNGYTCSIARCVFVLLEV